MADVTDAGRQQTQLRATHNTCSVLTPETVLVSTGVVESMFSHGQYKYPVSTSSRKFLFIKTTIARPLPPNMTSGDISWGMLGSVVRKEKF